MLVLIALGLALASIGVCIAITMGLLVRLARLEKRLTELERRPERVPLEGRHDRKGEPWGRGSNVESPLSRIRIALAITQDHPHPVFANLLKEALLEQEAIVDDAGPDLRVEGEILGNGYADVYFRAEIAVYAKDEAILAFSDKPPHGDRPANLAAEIVRRLRDELDRRERQSAMRELRG